MTHLFHPKRFLFWQLLILISILAACSGRDSVRVEGTILAADHSAIPRADVHWSRLGGNEATRHQTVDSSGNFGVNLSVPGFYRFRFSGVNHEAGETILDLSKLKNVHLRVYLSSNRTNSNPAQVYAIGSFNRFSVSQALPMNKQPNGSFTLTLPSDSETVAYQVVGPNLTAPVNGTAADSYQYDGSGGYISTLNPVNGEVTLVYDPSETETAGSPHIDFQDPAGETAAFAQAYEGLYTFGNVWQQALQDYQAGGGDPNSFRYDFGTLRDSLSGIIAGEKGPHVRTMQILRYMTLGLYGADSLSSDYARELLQKLNPDDPLWAVQPLAMPVAIDMSGKPDQYTGYLQKAARTNPDREVRATLIYYLLNKAYRSGDMASAHSYYDRLQNEFGGTMLAQYAKSEFSFDNEIAVGKPVPDFSVSSLDHPNVTFSKKNMLGKTYMIDFWATWCGPCRRELPYISKAYADFRDKGFQILSLSFDDSPQDVRNFRKKKYPMPWHHGFLKGGFENKIAREFNVNAIPSPILVGPKGIILAKGVALRGPNLEKTLRQILGKSG